ncbi:MAG: hypothetical protein HY795_08310 [Desulfovibrio sp.]|nr:hypothetical protein [Desulfovibrio sp.]MBI4960274.1 hypothetical protein [Desulfovibrio sp.]
MYLKLMRLIDAQILEAPFYGSRQMLLYFKTQGVCWAWPSSTFGALEGADGDIPDTTNQRLAPCSPGYLYFLRGMRIDRLNQVWCADVPTKSVLYVVAIMD